MDRASHCARPTLTLFADMDITVGRLDTSRATEERKSGDSLFGWLDLFGACAPEIGQHHAQVRQRWVGGRRDLAGDSISTASLCLPILAGGSMFIARSSSLCLRFFMLGHGFRFRPVDTPDTSCRHDRLYMCLYIRLTGLQQNLVFRRCNAPPCSAKLPTCLRLQLLLRGLADTWEPRYRQGRVRQGHALSPLPPRATQPSGNHRPLVALL